MELKWRCKGQVHERGKQGVCGCRCMAGHDFCREHEKKQPGRKDRRLRLARERLGGIVAGFVHGGEGTGAMHSPESSRRARLHGSNYSKAAALPCTMHSLGKQQSFRGSNGKIVRGNRCSICKKFLGPRALAALNVMRAVDGT